MRDLFLGRVPTMEEADIACKVALTVDSTALQSEILRNTV